MNSSTDDAASLVVSADTVPGYWMLDILWSPLVSTEQTKGAYSLMEQLMPAKSGPPLHIHDHGDEVFYILDGEMALQLSDEVIVGKAGQLVRIPAGTPHAFVVQSDTAKVLNIYMPGMLDMAIAMLGTPATGRRLPASEDQRPPAPEQQTQFAERLHDLAMQTSSSGQDLLNRYRGEG